MWRDWGVKLHLTATCGSRAQWIGAVHPADSCRRTLRVQRGVRRLAAARCIICNLQDGAVHETDSSSAPQCYPLFAE